MEKGVKKERVIESSGNVYADLGFEHPEEELAKAKLVSAIASVMRSEGLTQAKLAPIVCLDQPQISRLLRGQTGGFSTDRLIRILNMLGHDVEITVVPKPLNADRVTETRVSRFKST